MNWEIIKIFLWILLGIFGLFCVIILLFILYIYILIKQGKLII
jgi:hypothetical protein